MGAGTPANTRPARSNFEPWQGQIEAARPFGAEIDGRDLEARHRRATQVRADAFEHEKRRAHAAMLVLARTPAASIPPTPGPRAGRRPCRACRAFPRCGARRKSARPRHSTRSNAPGSSLLISTVTGAPSACARALGLKEATNGTAVAIAPAPPVTTVATVKKCRLVKPVLSATNHPLTDGVKHQEASLNNHEFPVPHGVARVPFVRRAVGSSGGRHYTQRPNGLATERARATC